MKKHYGAREILRVHNIVEQLEKKIRKLKKKDEIEREVINSLMRECYSIRKVLDIVDLSLAIVSAKRRVRIETGISPCENFWPDTNIDMIVEEHKKVNPKLSKKAQILMKKLEERLGNATDDDRTIKGYDEKKQSNTTEAYRR